MTTFLRLSIFLFSLSIYAQTPIRILDDKIDRGDAIVIGNNGNTGGNGYNNGGNSSGGNNSGNNNNPPPLVRYKDNIYSPHQIVTQSGAYYGSNPVTNGSLLFDYYTGLNPLPNRPAVFLLYGGGFTNGKRSNMAAQAYIFAMKGYAVFAIDYRLLGSYYHEDRNNRDENYSALCNGGNFNDVAWYWAMQDLNAAIKAVAYHKAAYRVDPNKIFLYGNSAGAITVLQMAYATEQEIFNTFPSVNFNASPLLGNLDKTTYPPARSQTYKIKGVAAVSGAMMRNHYLDNNETVGAIMLHSPCDTLVPYEEANNGLASIPGVPTCNRTFYGSRYIFDAMESWNTATKHELYVDCGIDTATRHDLNGNVMLNFIDKKVGSFFLDILNNTPSQPSSIEALGSTAFCNDNDDFKCNNSTQNKMSLSTTIQIEENNDFKTFVEEMESKIINNKIKIYPNPTKGEANFNIGLWKGKEVTVNIYGTIGNLIISNLVNVKDANQNYTIDLFNEAQGIYFVQVVSGSRNHMLKIIKQ